MVMRRVLVAALVAAHLLLPAPGWLLEGGVRAACSYSFFHANWFHLAANCVAVWAVFDPGRVPRGWRAWASLLVPYAIAVAVHPLAVRPCIGFSNILYAVAGLRTPPLPHPWWRSSAFAVFAAATLALAVIPRVSAVTHVAAFVIGAACAGLGRTLKQLTSDARRYV